MMKVQPKNSWNMIDHNNWGISSWLRGQRMRQFRIRDLATDKSSSPFSSFWPVKVDSKQGFLFIPSFIVPISVHEATQCHAIASKQQP